MNPTIVKIYLKYGIILAIVLFLSSLLALVFSNVIGQSIIYQIVIEGVIGSMFAFILGYKTVSETRKLPNKTILPIWIKDPFWQGAMIVIFAQAILAVVVFVLTKNLQSQGGLIFILFSGWGGRFAYSQNEKRSAKIIKILTVLAIILMIAIFAGKFAYGLHLESKQAEVWKEYTFTADHFRISSPVDLSLQSNNQNNSKGSAIMHLYSGNSTQGEGYQVFAYSFSTPIENKSKQYFEPIIQKFINKDLGMTLLSNTETTYNNHPETDFTVKIQKKGETGYLKGKIFVIDTYAYVLIIGTSDLNSKNADTFFNSFSPIQNPITSPSK